MEDVRKTCLLVSGDGVAVVADLAEILVSEISQTEVDLNQAKVTLGAESGEVLIALNAESEAIINKTVTYGSGDAGSPVSRLGESWGTSGAKVGSGNVRVAVGNAFQATVVDEEGRCGTGETDCGWSVRAVSGTSGNVGHDNADFSITKVVALLASNTVTLVINAVAVSITASDTTALNSEVEGVEIAGHAVEVVIVPEDASITCFRGADHRILRVGSDKHQAQRESEDR